MMQSCQIFCRHAVSVWTRALCSRSQWYIYDRIISFCIVCIRNLLCLHVFIYWMLTQCECVCTEPVAKVSTYIVLLSAHWYRTKYTPVSITCKPLFFQCHYCRFHLHRCCQLHLSLILQVGACLTACLPACVRRWCACAIFMCVRVCVCLCWCFSIGFIHSFGCNSTFCLYS